MSSVLSKEKLVFVRASMSNLKSDSENVCEYADRFGVDEPTAKAEMAEVMSADQETAEEFADFGTARMIALVSDLLTGARSAQQYGPAAKLGEMLTRLKKLDAPQQVEVSFGAPDADLVRARIANLMRNQLVRENAKLAEVDLDELASTEGVPVDAGVPVEDRFFGDDRNVRVPAPLPAPDPTPLPAPDPKAERPPKALATNLLAEELSRSRKV